MKYRRKPPWVNAIVLSGRAELQSVLIVSCDLRLEANRFPERSARSLVDASRRIRAWESRMIVRRFALSLAAIAAISADALGEETFPKSAAAADDGQLAFNNVCRTCHTLKEGDNRLGPNLHNIIGRKAGSLPDYSYSSAMKGADLVWDKATLDRYISNPDEVVPGNKMKPYGGVASAEERAKIIGYLEENGGG
jgi:cytochrome c